MLNGIKQRGIVSRDDKIEIQTPELPEGTIVEVIILVEQETIESESPSQIPQDTTEYLLSNEANRRHLMTGIKNIETNTNLVSFTPEEWNEEHNIYP
jgi:antitoxin YefM